MVQPPPSATLTITVVATSFPNVGLVPPKPDPVSLSSPNWTDTTVSTIFSTPLQNGQWHPTWIMNSTTLAYPSTTSASTKPELEGQVVPDNTAPSSKAILTDAVGSVASAPISTATGAPNINDSNGASGGNEDEQEGQNTTLFITPTGTSTVATMSSSAVSSMPAAPSTPEAPATPEAPSIPATPSTLATPSVLSQASAQPASSAPAVPNNPAASMFAEVLGAPASTSLMVTSAPAPTPTQFTSNGWVWITRSSTK